MSGEIRHSKKLNQFYITVNHHKAYLEYSKINDNILDFRATWTPEEYRGKGLASKITKVALEYARENGYKVKPTCPFVEKYIEAHEEYQELVV